MNIPKDSDTKIKDNDLLQELDDMTEFKPEIKTDDTININDTSPEPEKTDFTPAPEPEPIKEEPVKKVKPALPYDQQAEMLVAFVDGFQSLTLPWLYQKSIFNKEEAKKLKELKKKQENKEVVDETFAVVKDKYKDYKELIDDIPFTNEETGLIKHPLSKVMEKYDWNVGPEMLLVGALFTVMGPRLMPLFVKFE